MQQKRAKNTFNFFPTISQSNPKNAWQNANQTTHSHKKKHRKLQIQNFPRQISAEKIPPRCVEQEREAPNKPTLL